MPELYAYTPEDLNRSRTCLVNGFRVLLLSVVFWLVIGALVWRALGG